MQIAKVDNTSFKALDLSRVNTPKAEAFVKKEVKSLENLAKNYDITLSSEYIPFGFGDEFLIASVNSSSKKTNLLHNLFRNKKQESTSIEGCKSVSDLVNTAIANIGKDKNSDMSYRLALRDTQREGSVRIYSQDQIQTLRKIAESTPNKQ